MSRAPDKDYERSVSPAPITMDEWQAEMGRLGAMGQDKERPRSSLRGKYAQPADKRLYFECPMCGQSKPLRHTSKESRGAGICVECFNDHERLEFWHNQNKKTKKALPRRYRRHDWDDLMRKWIKTPMDVSLRRFCIIHDIPYNMASKKLKAAHRWKEQVRMSQEQEDREPPRVKAMLPRRPTKPDVAETKTPPSDQAHSIADAINMTIQAVEMNKETRFLCQHFAQCFVLWVDSFGRKFFADDFIEALRTGAPEPMDYCKKYPRISLWSEITAWHIKKYQSHWTMPSGRLHHALKLAPDMIPHPAPTTFMRPIRATSTYMATNYPDMYVDVVAQMDYSDYQETAAKTQQAKTSGFSAPWSQIKWWWSQRKRT